VTRLDDTSRIPEPGWGFRISALHTSDTAPAYLTGTWHRLGTQPADPACALWLVLAEQAGGKVQATVLADHEHQHRAYQALARYDDLPPAAWTVQLAPALAAHPWTTRVHHPKPRHGADRAARAILAFLITHH
jgi:hypothetical protein